MMQKKNRFTKIAILAFVVILFLTISGCSLLSYFKKKEVDMSSKYKNELEQNYSQATRTVNKFNVLVEKLKKHYYTTEDFTDQNSFASLSGSLLTDITTAQKKLADAKTSADKFGQTATGQKYSAYLSAKKSAINNLNKAFEEDKKMLGILTPAFNDFQNLFTYIDTLKKAQSSNITAAAIGVSRQNEQRSNLSYYNQLMSAQAMASASSTSTETASTGSSASTSTSTSTPASTTGTTATNTASGSAATTTTSSSSSSSAAATPSSSGQDLPSWVYSVLSSGYLSKYYINMLIKQQGQLDSLYNDVYQEDQKMNFKTSADMLKSIETIRTDLSDLTNSLNVLNNNLTEQARKNNLLDEYNNKKKSLEGSIDNLQYQIANPPSSVSANSEEVKGYKDQLAEAKVRLDRLNSLIKNLQANIKNLKAIGDGRLSSDASDDWWRYGGSLLGIMRLNKGVNRAMMRDIRSWEIKKINGMIKNHEFYVKLAKYQSTRAGMEFHKTSDSLALLQ